jgi:hypothetical protein
MVLHKKQKRRKAAFNVGLVLETKGDLQWKKGFRLETTTE